MNPDFWSAVGWLIAASGLGLAISAVFAAGMKLSRNVFLIPYVTLVALFLLAFFYFNKIDIASILIQNWIWGVLFAVFATIFLVRNVRSQPATRQSAGTELLFDIAWPGLIYGLTDALFLNIMPVLAVIAGTSQFDWTESLLGKVAVGILGLLASLVVTWAYHFGYPEFRSKKMGLVLVGNSVITLAFILSGNPFGSLISHPAMHIAAVLQGPETTLQLPPHYKGGIRHHLRKDIP